MYGSLKLKTVFPNKTTKSRVFKIFPPLDLATVTYTTIPNRISDRQATLFITALYRVATKTPHAINNK